MPGRELVWTVPNDDVRGCLITFKDGEQDVQEVTPEGVLLLIPKLESDVNIAKIVLVGQREFDDHKRRIRVKRGGGIRL